MDEEKFEQMVGHAADYYQWCKDNGIHIQDAVTTCIAVTMSIMSHLMLTPDILELLFAKAAKEYRENCLYSIKERERNEV